ncbi:hypothetical protein V2I01_34945 [Micromonospora sp. BRA006-A]|nr:hypothetical protein [Micromonospora sp. BRA006-A]
MAPDWSVPSRSTINRVLSRHDLLDRNPAKRPRSSWRRFAFAQPATATRSTRPWWHWPTAIS